MSCKRQIIFIIYEYKDFRNIGLGDYFGKFFPRPRIWNLCQHIDGDVTTIIVYDIII